MKTIVCFAGGTAGDLVTAMIDPLDCKYQTQTKSIELPKKRMLMKEFWRLKNEEKTLYIKKTFKSYDSLPSHDIDFHLGEKSHNIIGITCFDEKLRLRVAERFKTIHKEKVWLSLTNVTNTTTIKKYSHDIFEISRKIKDNFDYIDLTEIMNGQLLKFLQDKNFTIKKDSSFIYDLWLSKRSIV